MLASLLSYILGKGMISPRHKAGLSRVYALHPGPSHGAADTYQSPHPIKTRNMSGDGHERWHGGPL